jgi:hypothetical protein
VNRKNRLAVLFFLVVSVGLAEEPKCAKARFVSPSYSFGSVLFGQKIAHTFLIENTGDAPLSISEVVSHCPCVHAKFDKLIGPGKTGSVSVELDTSKLEGSVFMNVAIRSNDAERPLNAVEMKGFVRGPLALVPRDNFTLTTVSGQDKEQEFQLENNRAQSLRVLRVDSTDKTFAPSLTNVDAGKVFHLSVKADGHSAVGLHRGVVRIHTSDPSHAVIPVNFALVVMSDVIAEPSAVYLPALKQADARKGASSAHWNFVIKSIRGQTFKIVSVTSEAAFLEAHEYSISEATSHTLFVVLKSNELAKGRTIAKLHVKTSLPDAQDLLVPVWVEVEQ